MQEVSADEVHRGYEHDPGPVEGRLGHEGAVGGRRTAAGGPRARQHDGHLVPTLGEQLRNTEPGEHLIVDSIVLIELTKIRYFRFYWIFFDVFDFFRFFPIFSDFFRFFPIFSDFFRFFPIFFRFFPIYSDFFRFFPIFSDFFRFFPIFSDFFRFFPIFSDFFRFFRFYTATLQNDVIYYRSTSYNDFLLTASTCTK